MTEEKEKTVKYRTYRIEQSSPGFWVVTDPSQNEQCMGVFRTRREAKEFADEMIAAAGRGLAAAMREMRERATAVRQEVSR